MRYLIVLFLIVGCSSKYDDCVEQQKESYRQRNPGASYGLINSKYRDFQAACSNLKGK
jgi:hypothetical protein